MECLLVRFLGFSYLSYMYDVSIKGFGYLVALYLVFFNY